MKREAGHKELRTELSVKTQLILLDCFLQMGPEVGHYVKAVYDFAAQQSGELSLQVGDIVKVTDVIDDNWLQGEAIYGAAGSFPSNFVEPLILPDVRMGQRVFVAVVDFPSEGSGDLELTKGQFMWCSASAISLCFLSHMRVELRRVYK